MEGRYSRNMPALSPAECAALREKRVCVIGCGGLGGYIIEHLARIGIGALTLVDGDIFEASNLNRQLLCDENVLGQKKAEVAARRIRAVNSEVEVMAAAELFDSESAMRLLQGCDLAIDALDGIDSRKLLARSCAAKGIYMVHGAIGGWFGQVSVIPPGSAILDKLYPPRISEPHLRGNLGFCASVCASIQVAESIKILCGRSPCLENKLLTIDLKALEFTSIDIQ